MKPARPTNIPLRVKAYNKQFKTEEAKIYLKPGANPAEPESYTSKLYEKYLQEGAMLEVEDGMIRFHNRLGGIGGLNLRALNFLQVLAYLEYFENWRKARIENITAMLKKRNEEAEKAKAEQQAKEKTESENIKIEFVEENGVTKIKGTNFVISKIL